MCTLRFAGSIEKGGLFVNYYEELIVSLVDDAQAAAEFAGEPVAVQEGSADL